MGLCYRPQHTEDFLNATDPRELKPAMGKRNSSRKDYYRGTISIPQSPQRYLQYMLFGDTRFDPQPSVRMASNALVLHVHTHVALDEGREVERETFFRLWLIELEGYECQ